MKGKLETFDVKLIETQKDNEFTKNILIDYQKEVEHMKESQ